MNSTVLRTGFDLLPTDTIYRDFRYLNLNHVDSAIANVFENSRIAQSLAHHYEEEAQREISETQKLKLLNRRREALNAVDYWDWCHQGLKDLRYRDSFYPEMLRLALSGLDAVPTGDKYRYMGYHDGFYFEYFRRNDDPGWLREIDEDWNRHKIMFGPPPLEGHDLQMWK